MYFVLKPDVYDFDQYGKRDFTSKFIFRLLILLIKFLFEWHNVKIMNIEQFQRPLKMAFSIIKPSEGQPSSINIWKK